MIIEKMIYRLLLDNLEIVHVKNGGGDSSAIAIKHTTIDISQDNKDLEITAKDLAKEITNKIRSEM